MNRNISVCIISAATIFLTSCGGGSDQSQTAATTTLIADLNALSADSFPLPYSVDLRISGTSTGTNITGTARQTVGTLSNAQFRGVNGYSRFFTSTGTISDGSTSRNLSYTGQRFYDQAYNYLGSQDQDGYSVVSTNYRVPSTIRQYDTGVIGTELFYNNSNVQIGSEYTTFVVEAYDSNSLLMKWITRRTPENYTRVSYERITATKIQTLYDETNYDNGDYLRREKIQ
jgi:hypothetical protein